MFFIFSDAICSWAERILSLRSSFSSQLWGRWVKHNPGSCNYCIFQIWILPFEIYNYDSFQKLLILENFIQDLNHTHLAPPTPPTPRPLAARWLCAPPTPPIPSSLSARWLCARCSFSFPLPPLRVLSPVSLPLSLSPSLSVFFLAVNHAYSIVCVVFSNNYVNFTKYTYQKFKRSCS